MRPKSRSRGPPVREGLVAAAATVPLVEAAAAGRGLHSVIGRGLSGSGRQVSGISPVATPV